MSRYSAELKVMLRAAELAAKGLMRDFARLSSLPISEKGPSDFVSSADLDAQAVLCAELAGAFPRHGFLLEEDAPMRQGAGEARFIVDPLDGTTNFLHGIPHFAVSVALELEGNVAAGVVLNPTNSELFWAAKDEGSWLGERRIKVAPPKKIAHSLVGTGIPHLGRPGHERFMRSLARIMPQVAGIRRLGCAALDIAYVAAGRYDMFWEIGLSPWDVAAAQLLVKEAGGIVTTSDGEPFKLDSADILAASSEPLHRTAMSWLSPTAGAS
jgi:myo-inositol-1(or 4)-monophosphatase